MDTPKKKQCSVRQIEVLVNFMEDHLDLARGRVKSKEGRALSNRLWSECAELLNSYRDAKEWSKFYTDYKARLNNKIRKNKASQCKTGAGPSETVELTTLELRLANLLGHGIEDPLPGVRHNPVSPPGSSIYDSFTEYMVVEDEVEEENAPQILRVPSETDEEPRPNTSANPSPQQQRRRLTTQREEPTVTTAPPTSTQNILPRIEEKQVEANLKLAEAQNRIAAALERLGAGVWGLLEFINNE